MVTSQSSSVSSPIGRAMRTPALLTRTPISPRAADTCSTIAVTSPGRDTSPARPAASMPAPRSSSTSASTLDSVREQTPTR